MIPSPLDLLLLPTTIVLFSELVDASGYSVLSRACMAGHLPIASFLLQSVPGITQIVALNGCSALHDVVISMDLGDPRLFPIAKLLIDADPTIVKFQAAEDGSTALRLACLYGHTSVVSLILRTDASLARLSNTEGSTPMHIAAQNGHVDCVRALYQFDDSLCRICDGSRDFVMPIHLACMDNHTDVVASAATRPRPVSGVTCTVGAVSTSDMFVWTFGHGSVVGSEHS